MGEKSLGEVGWGSHRPARQGEQDNSCRGSCLEMESVRVNRERRERTNVIII